MDATRLQDAQQSGRGDTTRVLAHGKLMSGRLVPPAEFRRLLVSHRRMIRADRQGERLRGLQDLDTGEIFLTDERRLLELVR
jgi:hypothetical protein